jgi:hypothetical protein
MVRGGTLGTPAPLTIAGAIQDHEYTIAISGTQVVYDSVNVGPATFLFAFFWAATDCLMEIRGNNAAANSNILLKGTYWHPLYSNTTLTYNASGGFAGTQTPILLITLKNLSGAATVQARAAIFL